MRTDRRSSLVTRQHFLSLVNFYKQIVFFVVEQCRKEATAGGLCPPGAYTKHFVIHKDKRKIKICITLRLGASFTDYTLESDNLGNLVIGFDLIGGETCIPILIMV